MATNYNWMNQFIVSLSQTFLAILTILCSTVQKIAYLHPRDSIFDIFKIDGQTMPQNAFTAVSNLINISTVELPLTVWFSS